MSSRFTYPRQQPPAISAPFQVRQTWTRLDGRVCANLYIHVLRFEWDAKKDETNLVKHGIDFHTAQLVFDDPGCVTFIERTKVGEPRWHAIGFAEGIILLLVVHTYRDEKSTEVIRIISARQATRHERKLYEAAHR